MRFYINLTPLIPLSFEGEGDVEVLKGLRPFKTSFMVNKESQREAELVTFKVVKPLQTSSNKQPPLKGDALLTPHPLSLSPYEGREEDEFLEGLRPS